MGFFSNHQENNQLSVVKTEMNEIKERFFSFIEKLEQKTTDFITEAIPELVELNETDTDEYKAGYHRLKSAVLGQLQNIQQKASDIKEEKVTNFCLPADSHDLRKLYLDFRSECYERYNKLDELLSQSRQQIEDTHQEDYEIKYQKIIDEFEATKNNFRCMQCGSPILLTKIYFTTTYISCPSCQTRNTFEPSTQAKQLEHIGRSLAEQRTNHLLKEYSVMPEKIQSLYLQKHKLKLSLMREKDKIIIENTKKKIGELELSKQELEHLQPILYQKYLRAMFDEWNKINPDLAEEHEKFYNRLLTDYSKQN
ncbi:DNA-directed RNA polymerase subunit RPC12/RpoP [Flavobacterium arsenatis]|uniref:DNA-directed RNA polymerase subunit RPC12/RpoP n=1 Tax=Flavobacterium arsenatis TaxID=1484332 RepID=A0ABU1TMX3_9FLAO|nr:hypothetical protein [Flavobacterium arsenatis]MDR6967318.1 DNA-directed RNA polymerase subunit RPC12/RpoP [Flavobacterium arsenatis]